MAAQTTATSENKKKIWSVNFRPKVGQSVSHLDNQWVSLSGINSEPNVSNDNDWILVKSANNAAGIAIDDTNLVVAKEDELQSFAESVDSALLKDRGTGIHNSFTVSAKNGGTVFNISPLKLEISSDQGYVAIDFAGANNVTVANLNANSTFVYVDKDGNLAQQTTYPTRVEWVRKAFVARIVIDVNVNEIIGFEYFYNPIGQYSNLIRDVVDYVKEAGVPLKKGLTVTGKNNSLGFGIGAGSLLRFGGTGNSLEPSTPAFANNENVSFVLADRDSADSGGNTLIPKFWDNNGVKTPLGSTTVSGCRLYFFNSGVVALQLGQGNYANMTLAKAGVKLEEYVINPLSANATFLGWWLIESTATQSSGTVKAQFVEYTIGVQGGSSSSLSGAFLIGNNFSEILNVAAARSNLGIDTVLEDFQIKSEEQEVIIGGIYDNFQVDGNIIVCTNTDGKAVFTGFNISDDHKIIYLINNSNFEIQIDNENSNSLEENQISLPNNTANVGLQGTTKFAYITKGGLNKWQIIDVFGSRYMPEHQGLDEDAAVVVGEGSVSRSKQIVNLYEPDPSITSSTLTDAELNIRVPGKVIGFELICENAGDNGIVYKLVNDTTGVWKKFILT